MTKFKCSFCEKIFEVEIKIWVGHKKFFDEKEYINTICPECDTEQEQQRIIEQYKKMIRTLPESYRVVIDEYNFQTLVDIMKDDSIFLFGETGSGKTVFATMVLKELWLEGKRGIFWSYPEFLAVNNFDEARAELNNIKKYQGCLVIDDLGAERMTDFSRSLIYILINYRESNKLQTIITSNYSIEQLDHLVDKRISSRIAGMCKIKELEGDKRLKK